MGQSTFGTASEFSLLLCKSLSHILDIQTTQMPREWCLSDIEIRRPLSPCHAKK